MARFRNRYFKVSVFVLATVLALGILGASLVADKGSGEYDRVSSVEDLATARGVVADWAQTADGRVWFINGEWTLDCHGPCVNARLQNINFDLAYAMYRAELPQEANESHGHPFWDFSASSVEVSEDETGSTLTIVGTITGSGEIGTDGITIKLVKHTRGHFTFFFKMDEGNAFATEAGGVVVESKGNKSGGSDDDDN
jgi:hypothetical protein